MAAATRRGISLLLCICEAVLTFAFTVSSAAQSDKDMQMTGRIAIYAAALSIVGTVNRHRRQNLHPETSALCAEGTFQITDTFACSCKNDAFKGRRQT